MLNLPPITLRLRSFKLIDRVALAFLLLCSILFGTACGLLFVYASDLPEIRALETYRPNVVTEIYGDDGQLHGNYGFAAAAQFYFGKSVGDLTLPEAALLAGMINGPKYSPLLNPEGALSRRNLVLHRMEEEGRVTPTEEAAAIKSPLALHLQYPRNDLAPYFFEEIRKYLEATYGTEAVHERGLRVYTTLNIAMQKAANQAIRDGLHPYDRRHGWRDVLPNILKAPLGTLESYEDDDWRRPIEKGSYVTGLVTAVDEKYATVKIGSYRAV